MANEKRTCHMSNEKRLDLIDRNELLPNGVFYVNGDNPMASLNELLNRIANANSVDAVEVVRCKDCKHYFHYGDGVYGCRTFGMMKTKPDGFCSDGERREGE
jgi:hypothetical protein